MSILLISIILSSFLFTGFKWFDTQGIKLLPAIAGNYAACILTALVVNTWFPSGGPVSDDPAAIWICLGMGVLFFFTFYAMAYVSAYIGVGVSGASSKMSLIIPVLTGVCLFEKTFEPRLAISVVLALSAVILMTWTRGKRMNLRDLSIAFLVFLGSGIIDTAFGLIQALKLSGNLLNQEHIIYIFIGAGCSSLLYIAWKQRVLLRDFRSIGYGFLLGIPNYFSILVIFIAMASESFVFHKFFMINNTGVMLLSFFLGLIFFREKINLARGIGIIFAILSMYLILYR